MNFGAMEMPQLNKYSLDLLNFPKGIFVFLLGLVFFLDSAKHDIATKIDFTFFKLKCIYCAYPKFLLISVYFTPVEIQLHACIADCTERLRWLLRGLHVASTWRLTGRYLNETAGGISAVGSRRDGGD